LNTRQWLLQMSKNQISLFAAPAQSSKNQFKNQTACEKPILYVGIGW
jgi:hypothetical protein